MIGLFGKKAQGQKTPLLEPSLQSRIKTLRETWKDSAYAKKAEREAELKEFKENIKPFTKLIEELMQEEMPEGVTLKYSLRNYGANELTILFEKDGEKQWSQRYYHFEFMGSEISAEKGRTNYDWTKEADILRFKKDLGDFFVNAIGLDFDSSKLYPHVEEIYGASGQIFDEPQ